MSLGTHYQPEKAIRRVKVYSCQVIYFPLCPRWLLLTSSMLGTHPLSKGAATLRFDTQRIHRVTCQLQRSCRFLHDEPLNGSKAGKSK